MGDENISLYPNWRFYLTYLLSHIAEKYEKI